MNTDKYLPIGTVVLLKDAKKKIMITGFAVRGKESGDRIFDYNGCLYPEGVIASDKNLLFDHSQIDKIFYMGYISDEEVEFKKEFNKIVDEFNKQSIQGVTMNSNNVDNNMNYQQSNVTTQNLFGNNLNN